MDMNMINMIIVIMLYVLFGCSIFMKNKYMKIRFTLFFCGLFLIIFSLFYNKPGIVGVIVTIVICMVIIIMLGGHIYQTWAKDAKDCNEFYTPNIDEHILNNYKNKLDSYFKKDVLYLLKSALFMCVSIYVITKTLTYIFEFVVVPAINFAAVVSTSYIFVSFMSIYLIHLSNKKSLGAIAPYARKIVCKKIVKKKYYIEWVDPLVYENDELSDRESKVTRHEYNDLDVNDSILIFNKGKKLFIFKNN